jgi:hypothetical protein
MPQRTVPNKYIFLWEVCINKFIAILIKENLNNLLPLADETQMIVTWVTPRKISTVPKVEYGTSSYEKEAEGSTTLFTNNGKRHIYIHRVIVKGLQPRHRYS